MYRKAISEIENAILIAQCGIPNTKINEILKRKEVIELHRNSAKARLADLGTFYQKCKGELMWISTFLK